MNDDAELLRRYAEDRTEAPFAELVRRHLPLVYAAALRQVGGAVHRAEDVTQTVFIELARNARVLARRSEIVGWLYTTTHFTAAKLKRGEQRRQNREHEAHIMQQILSSPAAEIDWERLRPVLDDAMHDLSPADRDMILLRFFQSRRLADVGRSAGLSEDAARMRIERALQKLRSALARREITSTTAALAAVLASQTTAAAPASLAATITSAAISATAAAGTGAGTGFITMTKLKLGIAASLATAGAIGLVLQVRTNAQLRDEASVLRQDANRTVSLREQNLQLARTLAEAERMRGDEAKLAALNAEAAGLQARLGQITRLEKARAAQAQPAAPDLAQLDFAPRPTFQMRPDFPIELREHGIGGEVLVNFTVDADGSVRDVRVAPPATEPLGKSSRVILAPFTVAASPLTSGEARSSAARPSDGEITRWLETYALEAVTGWKFAGGRKGGRSVSTDLQVAIVFSIAQE